MNKIKSLFFLLFCFTLFACTTVQVSAQDYRLSLGKAWIRYDSDSNLIKFGAPIQPPKIAREFNSPLFNFNSTQFFWSNLTGLNLISYNSPDTILASPLIVVKDTGDGEFIPYNKRTYTIYKPYYHNQLDIYDLKVKYESTANPSKTTEFNLFNNAYIIYDTLSLDIDISQNYFNTYWTFNNYKKGQYLVLVNYEYSFPELLSSKSKEQIDVSLLNIDNMNTLANNIHTYYRNPTIKDGQTNSASMSCIIDANLTDTKNIGISFVGNSNAGNPIYLNKLRIIAVLIN